MDLWTWWETDAQPTKSPAVATLATPNAGKKEKKRKNKEEDVEASAEKKVRFLGSSQGMRRKHWADSQSKKKSTKKE